MTITTTIKKKGRSVARAIRRHPWRTAAIGAGMAAAATAAYFIARKAEENDILLLPMDMTGSPEPCIAPCVRFGKKVIGGGGPPVTGPIVGPVDDDAWTIEGDVTISTEDEWKCKRAKKLLVPDPQSIVPEPLLSGPIGMAIVGGISSVNVIAKAIGWKKRCTIRGGVYQVLELVPRQPLRVWARVELVPHGQPPIAKWVFDTLQGSTQDTTIVPERDKAIVGSAADFSEPARHYLFHGGTPPAPWWPHVNISGWLHPLPETVMGINLRQPRVDVVRSGDTLAVGVWIPPRAPPSHLNNFGQRIVDRQLDWNVKYWIGSA